MTWPHTPFPCRTCGTLVHFERCSDFSDTDHRWLTAMECPCCGGRVEYSCRGCAAIAAHPSHRETR